VLIDAPFNSTTKLILDSAVEVHRPLGPGLLESTYLVVGQFEKSEPLGSRAERAMMGHAFASKQEEI
jgi:hypothetical protein